MESISRRAMLQFSLLAPWPSERALPSVQTEAAKCPFVLVHGAWHGGWCYSRVAEILRTRGHRVFTPTLTGVGERSHLANAGVNMSTHVQDVINVIQWENLSNVVLCGHSYGGIVIGSVADRISDRVASCVYLDAIIPSDGMSLVSMLMGPNDIGSFFRSTAKYGGQMVPPVPAEMFNVNAADRTMVNALCTPQPLATFIEPAKLGTAYKAIRKKTYILATGWSPSPFTSFHAQVKNDSSWQTLEVACGHDVMIDEPAWLADTLAARCIA